MSNRKESIKKSGLASSIFPMKRTPGKLEHELFWTLITNDKRMMTTEPPRPSTSSYTPPQIRESIDLDSPVSNFQRIFAIKRLTRTLNPNRFNKTNCPNMSSMQRDISEWSKCRFTTKTPKRRTLKIPAGFKDAAPFKGFKSKCSERVFEVEPPPSMVVVKKEEPERPCKENDVPIKKLKAEPKDEADIKKEKDLQKKIEKQNKTFHKYRSALSDLAKKDLHVILEANSQDILKGKNKCLDHIADMMSFGVLDPCPECKGQFVLDTFYYKCTGDISEWSKCRFTTKTPKRRTLKIPAGFKDAAPFKGFKSKCSERVFEVEPPPSMVVVKKEEPERPCKENDVPIKKLKAEPKDEADIKKEKDLQKKIEKQNKTFHKYRSALSDLAKKDLHVILEANSQNILKGKNKCLDHIADMMSFGVLDPCPECKGQFVLDTFYYKCTGDISEWSKCRFTIKTPKRHTLKIPAGFKDAAPFKGFKSKCSERVFEVEPPPSMVVVNKEEPERPCKENDVPIKKLKAEPKDEADIKKEKDLQKKIEKQNKTFHKYRSALSDLAKKDLHVILEANSQDILKGKNKCLDHIADMMSFGVLDPCPECKGQFVLDTFYYKCTGDISEWSKCRFTTKTPKRHTLKIPAGFKDAAPFKGFKSKCSERVFEVEPPPSMVVVNKEEPERPCKENDVPIKKLKAEPKDEADIKKEKDLQKKIEKQNKTFHKYRSALSDLAKKDLHVILEANSQDILKGKNKCLDHIADMMSFGVLDPCPECKGQFVLDTFYYKCTGDISEWSKCRFTTKTPKRHTLKIPAGFKDAAPFKGFKSKCSERVFEVEPPPSMVVVNKEEPERPCKENDVPIKKLKAEPKDEADIKKEKDLQKKIEKQNKTFHKYRSALSDLAKKDLHVILEANSQDILKGKNKCLDHIADMMSFGVLDPCPECKGQFVLDTFYYKCTGDISEWSKCRFTTKTPKRHTLKIPAGFKDAAPFKGLKSKCSERVFEVEPPPSMVVVNKEEPERPCKENDVPIKKLKAEPKDEADIKKEKDLQKKIEKQNKTFHKYRSALSDLAKKDLHVILEANSQDILKGKNKCLDHIADMMSFGVLDPCPECKGQFVLDTFYYKCTGDISEWSKCRFTIKTPKRHTLKIPAGFKDAAPFKGFKSKCSERVFEVEPPPSMVVVKKEEPESSQKVLPLPPLKNLQFFLYGGLKKKLDTKNRILKLGGLVVSRLTETLAGVVSTKKDLEKMTFMTQYSEEFVLCVTLKTNSSLYCEETRMNK